MSSNCVLLWIHFYSSDFLFKHSTDVFLSLNHVTYKAKAILLLLHLKNVVHIFEVCVVSMPYCNMYSLLTFLMIFYIVFCNMSQKSLESLVLSIQQHPTTSALIHRKSLHCFRRFSWKVRFFVAFIFTWPSLCSFNYFWHKKVNFNLKKKEFYLKPLSLSHEVSYA